MRNYSTNPDAIRLRESRWRRGVSRRKPPTLDESPYIWLFTRISREPTGTGCYEWIGALDKHGYGIANRWIDRVTHTYRAHREVYTTFVGPLPDDLELDHLCSNPACVRPSHLEPVTGAENKRRTRERGRHANAKKTHCLRGHEFTPENTRIGKSGSRFCIACSRMR